MKALDLDDYSAQATEYVLQKLRNANVELDDADAKQMASMVYRGLVTAKDSGGEHWELAFRGAVEVLVERMAYLAHQDVSLPPRVDGSRLSVEEGKMVEQFSFKIQIGKWSLGDLCPLWPFC